MSTTRKLLLIPLILFLAACAAPQPKQQSPLDATRQLVTGAAQSAGNEEYSRQMYEARTWVPSGMLSEDPVELGKEAEIPVQKARVKLLGPSQDDALRSLALKIWLIENAQHTVDVVYYIFKTDLVGQSMLGALCNAVQRGVDVRIMVDSIGSMSPSHNGLRALETCAENAGY